MHNKTQLMNTQLKKYEVTWIHSGRCTVSDFDHAFGQYSTS